VSDLRFYLDENVPTEVGTQLRSSGIDAVTARDLGSLGAADRDHLERATVQSRMLCTHDQDFLRLAAAGTEHAGIAFSSQTRVSIGGWVRELRALHTRFEAEQVKNLVFFLSLLDPTEPS
jgi:predicted nuclease of predicted toxin-antitoxin system